MVKKIYYETFSIIIKTTKTESLHGLQRSRGGGTAPHSKDAVISKNS